MNAHSAFAHMGFASESGHRAVPAMLQRACACGGHAGASGLCPSCADQARYGAAPELQRDASAAAPDVAPPIVNQTLARSGMPLDAATRAHFEPRFGQSLGHVRIHTDAMAADSAASVGARAYTVGRHIVFGEGQWQPRSEDGQRVLAHELGHVFQQRGAEPPIGPIRVGPSGDRYEQAADRIAADMVGGGLESASIGPAVQRLEALATDGPVVQRGECSQPGKYPKDKCAIGRKCGWGKSGVCSFPSLEVGCECLGQSSPTVWQVVKVLVIIGASITLAALIILALLDPEPASKLALAGLSLVQAVTLLVLLGYSEDQIRDMGLDPSLSTASNDAIPPADGAGPAAETRMA